MVDQFEVDQANLAGRLHPSQRVKLLGGLVLGALMVLVGGAIMAFLFGTAIANDMFEAVYLAEMIPVYVLFLGGLWIFVRRLLDLTGGRVVAVTEWCGPEVPLRNGLTDQAARDYGKMTYHSRAQTHYKVRVGKREYQIDKPFYDRIPVNCTNTAFLTPRTKLLLNIVRTPGH